MVNMRAIIVLSILATCVAINFYKINLGGRMPGSGDIGNANSRSRLGCTKACSEHSGCKSIFYVPSTNVCQCHSIRYTSSSPSIGPETQPAEYYEKFVYLAPATPESSPTPSVCPTDNDGVNNRVLPDDSIVNVRVFYDTTRNFPDAKAKCESEGGQMYEITTPVKMNFTLNLMRCPAYASAFFWIDGVYNTDTSVWETTDRKPLPMSQGDFWYSGSPNGNGNDHCVVMNHPDFNFLWDDGDCEGAALWTICDMS